jgi:hypothetical protein
VDDQLPGVPASGGHRIDQGGADISPLDGELTSGCRRAWPAG